MSIINFDHISLHKRVYAFEVDDILYDKKDYVLQIYYLFANFVEFTEGKTIAKELLDFMKTTYETGGEDQLIDKTLSNFNLGNQYIVNFERLYANAQLQLKLLLLESTKEFMQKLISLNKRICILTKGNPVMQLNKLKHLDWQGLDKNIKVFFVDELLFRKLDPNSYLATDFQVDENDLMFIDSTVI